MKKILFVIVLLLLVVGGAFCYFSSKDGNTRISNDKAEKDKNERYLTVINDTDKIINEVHVFVGEGTEIEAAYQENPDEKSFSIKIPKQYDEYNAFKVSLVDNYGFLYTKELSNVCNEGRTEVAISQDDYVKQSGDWKKKINEFFNK